VSTNHPCACFDNVTDAECAQAYGAHTAQSATGGYDAQQQAAYNASYGGYAASAAGYAAPAPAAAAAAPAAYGGYEDASGGYNSASAAARYHPYSR
jgi:hypothetical protein